MTEAHVTRIDVDADGRAAGVQYLKSGETYVQPAAVVLLACYTYENARLLLLVVVGLHFRTASRTIAVRSASTT